MRYGEMFRLLFSELETVFSRSFDRPIWRNYDENLWFTFFDYSLPWLLPTRK